MSQPMLPAQFAGLEPFAAAGWCLATERERYTKRLESSMSELQAFYDAAFPRFGEMVDHLDEFPLDDLPVEERNLLYLVYSVIQASLAVDMWGQPHVIDAGNAMYFRTVEPIP
jgi:hypothetical protein